MMLAGQKQMWCFIGQATQPKERSRVCPCLQAQLGAAGLVLCKPRQPPAVGSANPASHWGWALETLPVTPGVSNCRGSANLTCCPKRL